MSKLPVLKIVKHLRILLLIPVIYLLVTYNSILFWTATFYLSVLFILAKIFGRLAKSITKKARLDIILR